MQAFKKVALFIVVTIMVALLVIWSIDAFGFRSPVAAFLINWLVMSWLAMSALSIPFPLPSEYYAFKAFESSGQLYERLGIRLFKKLVRRGPLSIFSPTLRFPKKKTVAALQQLDQEMRKAEAIHVFIFIVMWLFISFAVLRGWFDAAGWLLLFNVLINGYPVMLQRYNRIKLHELIQSQAAIRPATA